MAVEPALQATFERNLAWKRSWPRCFLGFLATLEILITLIIFLTEVFNILMDFWYMNVFGGIWTSIIIFINWILIYVTVCCTTTIRASTCALVWNIITLIALSTLIAFDIVFILNPYTCLLTPTCTTQSEVISLNSIMQMIPTFQDYTSFDSKRFFLEIQVGCAGVAFIISFIYIIIFIVCKMKIRRRIVHDYPARPIAAQHQEYPVPQAPPSPWTSQTAHVPYAPY